MFCSKKTVFIVLITLFAFVNCTQKETDQMKIEKEVFGEYEGQPVYLYTLTNDNGMKVSITNYGGIVQKIIVPDKDGNLGDVVLGYDKLEDYVKDSPYFGASIGRYGNRIAKGKFSLNDSVYTLATNNGPNHLHGGDKGFDKVLWDAKMLEDEKMPGLELSHVSVDGEEGYPGTLSVKVTFTLTNDNELKIDYWAETDKPTVCNLTNHSYFNLKDGGKSPILDHLLFVDSDRYTPIDETLIPTGELAPVEGTPFNFTEPTKIGAWIDTENEQLVNGKGYDHNFVLNNWTGEMRLVGWIHDEASGRKMEIFTVEPGLQFYSGNFLDGTLTGKNGVVYNFRTGMCLETQHFPDSPNQPDFPSTTLLPGETYETHTIYKFSVMK
ncbi:MAG: galactose mutarotase [Melioribacteraceae bacterium]|nr:galactose mutarotase [Melioribacteraceae bacterium]MCF8356513.1 galactose mutarotase [Melioribacteraceae bacterium]MCF8396123.1 galactose mutarotase [Melioribacteraceae bacterium]MCF8420956.1 galactose mutarotase [Melioribacteraceae bacterium]